MKTVSNFTEGSILGPLLRFAFPILFAMFFTDIVWLCRFDYHWAVLKTGAAGAAIAGAGRAKFVMIQGIVGAFCLRVTVCYIIHHFFPDSIFYLSLSTPCSTFTQILICFVYFKIFIKKGIKNEN